MDKEELFNDGVNLLETLRKKFIKEREILKSDESKYYINFPDSHYHVADLDLNLPKFVVYFPVYMCEYGDDARYEGTLSVLLEDNLKIVKYTPVSEAVKTSGRIIIKNVSELKYERNYEMITHLAELYYIAKSLNRFENGSSEYKRAYNLYLNELDKYENILKEYKIKPVEERKISDVKNYDEVEEKIKDIEENTVIIPRNKFNCISEKYRKLNLNSSQVHKLIELHHAPFLAKKAEISKANEEVIIEKTNSAPINEHKANINNVVVENVNIKKNEVNTNDQKSQTTIDDNWYNNLKARLDAGNSEKKVYDFRWAEPRLLEYADDSSLEIAYSLIERGKISLSNEKNKICITSYLDSFCDLNETNEDYFNNYEKNHRYMERKKESTWKFTMGNAFLAPSCHNCKFQSCPKYLAAYILYLKNMGALKERLIEREQFRNENNTSNGFFLFKLNNKKGLKKVDEKSFEFASWLVDKDFIRVRRNLNNDEMVKIEEVYNCNDLQISNLDVDNFEPSGDWEKNKYVVRNLDFEPGELCSSYTCRLPSCITTVAAYIYYLKKTNQDHIIKEDREYYFDHKDEIDKEIYEEAKKKEDILKSQKEEKLQDIKESYDGKIENLNMTINGILESNRTNFHCIVTGDDKDEKAKFIEKIIELLKTQNKLQNVREIPLNHLARLYYHTTNVRINKNEELVYGDNEIEEKSTFKRDSQDVRYEGGYKIHRKNKLEENAIYVLDGIREFVCDYNYYADSYVDKKMMLNAIDVLSDMSSNRYVIINAEKDEIDTFLALDTRLKFVYQNNIINIPTYSIDDMYNNFLLALNYELVNQLKNNEEEYKKRFYEYVGLNQSFMPFNKKEIVNYIATYINTRNELVFPPNVYKKENLDNIIGLESVKEKLKEFEKYMLFQLQAKANGINIGASNMHMIFTGNPGTGKTTVARIMAKMLFDLGIVKENKLIEVERKDLIGRYIGQTAIKTAEVIDSAIGGVLFIDEAYTLASGSSNDFGAEAIATLIKAMEDHKDKLVVIFAGYRNEMKDFTDINPGIASRIGYTFDFPDYSVDELIQIFYLKLKNSGFEYDESIELPLRRLCEYYSRRKNFGNGRFISKVYQETLMNHALSKTENIKIIDEKDIPTIEELNQNEYKRNDSETAEEMLSHIVGMKELKEEILSFGSYISFVKEAQKHRVKIPDSNMHMIFTGNPGTGKTTIARIIAKMLFEMEVIHENKLIEVERKDLVAGYIGQTAIKTTEVIDSAMGGVLFIDEAYTLASGSSNDFGAEAIATLIKAMEDRKGEFVVIFAGYKKEMRDFLEANPGIASRVGYTFNFEDYSDRELTEIFIKKVSVSGMKIETGVIDEIKKIMKYFYKVENIGNGRFVDKVLTKILLNHSKNYAKTLKEVESNPDYSDLLPSDDVITIKVKDIPTIQDITKILLDGNSMIDPSRVNSEDIRKTAIHEVGHATVGYLLSNRTGIKKITCTAEGTGALGYVEYDISNDSYTSSKEELFNKIKRLLAGIGSEEVFLGVYKNGGTSDLRKATSIARNIITDYGMSDLGLAHIPNNNTELEKIIYEEENKILDKCFKEVKELIKENKDKMERVVTYLLENSEIDEEQFIKVFNGENE